MTTKNKLLIAIGWKIEEAIVKDQGRHDEATGVVCAQAAIRAIQEAGWAIVPREPTVKMATAGLMARHKDRCSCGIPWDVVDPEDSWPSMLAAAPDPLAAP